LRIASFCRRRPGSLVGSPIARFETGKRLFITPFSTSTAPIAASGRDAVQGRKKTARILKHGKFTYKEISIMSIEAEKAPLLAWLAKASVKGSLGRKSEEKEAIYSRYQEISGGHRLGTAVKYVR
jgi:hypothetical protein